MTEAGLIVARMIHLTGKQKRYCKVHVSNKTLYKKSHRLERLGSLVLAAKIMFRSAFTEIETHTNHQWRCDPFYPYTENMTAQLFPPDITATELIYILSLYSARSSLLLNRTSKGEIQGVVQDNTKITKVRIK